MPHLNDSGLQDVGGLVGKLNILDVGCDCLFFNENKLPLRRLQTVLRLQAGHLRRTEKLFPEVKYIEN